MSLQQARQRQTISQTQSIAVVQTLLKAGLGCITFLRNLLPDDNFSESHFTTSEDSTPPSSQTSGPSSTGGSRQRVSGFKIMTMARGYSEEADRILNYLEYGIFDALGKQYLRSFIFAIYLPTNLPSIVEAYTFNFRYHKLPESDSIVPIMTLGDDLQRSGIGGLGDPVAEAARKGRTPTLRDVKKSVKTLLKTLIHAMSQMDVLPKRRYATFKIFYTDSTPSDYEPPYFQSGDAEKDRWYMMTHNLDEVPDKWGIGKIDTGHHSVNLNITSIATYLPSVEHQGAAFSGTTDTNLASQNLTPIQEAEIRAQQIEQQERDAEMRNLVWSTEADAIDLDRDAEGEDDPDYARQPDGSFLRVSDSHIPVPIGIRNEAGVIEAIVIPKTMEEAVYGGAPESVPVHLSELVIRPYESNSRYAHQVKIPRLSTMKHRRLPSTDSTPRCHQATQDENADEEDNGLVCECDVSVRSYESCFCEGGCAKWFHICYHSIRDKRIPARFICFDCRLRADVSWELIKTDLYPRLMSKHRDLALFRRSIKIVERMKILTPADFSKQLGFIQEYVAEVDELGIIKTRPKKKGAPKQTKQRRNNMQKSQYQFNRAVLDTPKYRDYFDPSLQAENRLLCIGKMKAKISVATGVDLAE
ncbi:HORMA-domain-containing protein [Macrolepiota fuliginosa MF-IS2]|uniref:HORMA-domain-containing protein n=1 Tax=Macrolepiota fuliginosa MF-IS2 TaxID=1400762 RepID=A0A9P5XAK2_9AGAR|nr:HORMA-domain-containing protein [Macrolepiota fuliginosa MF-IS2]